MFLFSHQQEGDRVREGRQMISQRPHPLMSLGSVDLTFAKASARSREARRHCVIWVPCPGLSSAECRAK